jgi:hypothetical protein
MKKHYLSTLVMLLSMSGAMAAGKKPYCGNLENAFGPFDYRTIEAEPKHLVESAHFPEEVEYAVKGVTGTVAGDLDYTLRAIPNHPRALVTVMRLVKRKMTTYGLRYPAECYFERAVRFQPDDADAWALYAQYLYETGHPDSAQPMLEKAVKLAPDNPAINYNMGLVYAKQKQFDKALPLAHKAYGAGFPLPGLKQMLVSANKWVEPPPRVEEAEDAAASKPETPPEAAPSTAKAPNQEEVKQ